MGPHLLSAWQGGYFDSPELRVRRKIKLRWLDVARPDHGYGLLATGLNWHSAWAVFRWMVETAQEYKGVIECLREQGTCINCDMQVEFSSDWKAELQRRFLCAVLDQFVHGNVDRWRRDLRIGPSGELVLWSKWYTGGPSPADIAKRTDALFAIVGRKLKHGPNRSRPRARTIKDVHLIVRPDHFELDLWYSFASDKYSGWHLYIRHQGTFFEFLQHAEAELARLLIPVTEGTP